MKSCRQRLIRTCYTQPNNSQKSRSGAFLFPYPSSSTLIFKVPNELGNQVNIEAIFFDLSGVLFEGQTAITGASDAVAKVREQNLIFRFVTNTATLSNKALIDKLAGFGIEVKPEELFSAPVAAKNYVTSRNLRPFCLVHPNILEVFADLPQSQPNCVVLGDVGDELNYTNLNNAFYLCKQGAPLIAIGKNKYFKDQGKLQLDSGAFVHGLEWATDCKAIIMGKPSVNFFLQVVESTGLAPEQCLMVGDDVQADVLSATRAGLRGCLVKTGKFTPGDESLCASDNLILENVTFLPEALRRL